MNKKQKYILITLIIYIISVFIFRDITYDYYLDKSRSYNQALKIYNDEKMFDYALDTNVGNILAEGKIFAKKAIDFDKNKYISIEKVTEKLTRHTRIKTYTSNGKTRTKVEVYYTWDVVDIETKKSEKVRFLNKEFNTNNLKGMETSYIKTERSLLSNIRYKYYGFKDKSNVTIAGNTLSGKLKGIDNKGKAYVYKGKIQDVLEAYNANRKVNVYTLFYTIIYLVVSFVIYLKIFDVYF